MDLALRWLSAAERTTAELRSRLLGKGFKEADVDLVIRRLESAGLVSDERVLQREAEKASQSYSGRLKAAESMLRRGLDEDSVLEVVRGMDDEDELAKARHILQLKLRPGDAAARAARLLAARGFDEETVRRAVAERFPELDWA